MHAHKTKYKPAQYILFSYVGIFLGLGICYAVIPRFLHQEGGISNYGIHRQTVVPYTLGFVLYTACTAQAARLLQRRSYSPALVTRGLYGLSMLSLVVLLSTYPYKMNQFLDLFHKSSSILFLSYELAFGWYLALVVMRNWLSVSLFAAQLACLAVLVFTLMGRVHLLFIGELAAGLIFGTIVYMATDRIVDV